jgi:TonB family protein
MRKHDPRPALAAALPLVVLALAACAPGVPAGPSLFPAGWTPQAGQRCELSDAPRQLPSVDQVVDSAALARDLAGAPAGGYGLFTVGFDTLGMADTVRLSGGDLADGARTAWYGAVTRRMRNRTPFPAATGRRGRPQGWAVLLRVDAGASPAMRVGRSEECAPVLVNATALQAHMQQQFARLNWGSTIQQRPSRVMLEFVVDSMGMVRDARVATSTGLPGVEELALQLIRLARFQPVIVNRQPIAVVVKMPIVYQADPPRTPSAGRP